MSIFLIFLVGTSFGYSERVDIRKFDQIRIGGWAAKIKVVANEKIKFARIRSASTAVGETIPLNITIDAKTLHVKVLSGESPLENKQLQPVDIFLEAPSLPLKISLRSGSIEVNEWGKPLNASLIDGKISTRNHRGTQLLHVKKGNVVVLGGIGNLDISNYDGLTRVEKLVGELKLLQFSGRSEIREVEGPVKLKGYNSKIELSASRGRADFDLYSGQLRTRAHEGAIYGTAVEAGLYLGVKIDPNVRVKTKTGKVVVSLPAGSGAFLNFGSEKGDLIVPAHFAVERLPNLKVARGRLKGTLGRGQVRVRTESAIAIFRVDR